MAAQEAIASELNEAMAGMRLKVLVERTEDGMIVGRTQYDSPEVDPEILVSPAEIGNLPVPGEMIDVEVSGSDAYDLRGIQV